MTPELKAKWIAALRSGQYKQGKGALCSKDTFCCLGVLAEVFGAQKQSDAFGTIYLFETGVLTDIDYEWDMNVPEILLDEDNQDELTNMNDAEGKSFAEIADWIEENVP